MAGDAGGRGAVRVLVALIAVLLPAAAIVAATVDAGQSRRVDTRVSAAGFGREPISYDQPSVAPTVAVTSTVAPTPTVTVTVPTPPAPLPTLPGRTATTAPPATFPTPPGLPPLPMPTFPRNPSASVYTFAEPGVYAVFLIILTTSGCAKDRSAWSADSHRCRSPGSRRRLP